jgi:hypothetical protein
MLLMLFEIQSKCTGQPIGLLGPVSATSSQAVLHGESSLSHLSEKWMKWTLAYTHLNIFCGFLVFWNKKKRLQGGPVKSKLITLELRAGLLTKPGRYSQFPNTAEKECHLESLLKYSLHRLQPTLLARIPLCVCGERRERERERERPSPELACSNRDPPD